MTSVKRLVRSAVPLGCFMLSLATYGQSPAAGANWRRVQQLPLHTQIHVKADSKGRVCSIDSVDDGHLSCSTGRVVQTSHYTFQRSEIESIRLAHYVRSTLLGTAAGGGAGAIAAAATNNSSKNGYIDFPNSAAAGAGALVFGVAGAIIGAVTDFSRGPTVYRR